MEVLFLFILPCVFALIVSSVAKDRGRDPVPWGVYGFLLGIIALIHVMCLKPIPAKEETP